MSEYVFKPYPRFMHHEVLPDRIALDAAEAERLEEQGYTREKLEGRDALTVRLNYHQAEVALLAAQLNVRADNQSDEFAQVRAAKDGAYSERNELVAFLSRLYPSHLCRHPDEDKEWEDDWRWIVCVHSPTGQLTWHIHDSELPKFAHLEQQPGHWDGHTTTEKYERLRALGGPVAAPAPAPIAEATPVAETPPGPSPAAPAKKRSGWPKGKKRRGKEK